MKVLEHHRNYHSMIKFYDWFYKFYPVIEHFLGKSLKIVTMELFDKEKGLKNMTAIEYASGSGLLTLTLADYFRSVDARDASINMLEKGRVSAARVGKPILFNEGNILSIDEKPGSFDYVFVSFALHLFPENQVKSILGKMLSVARKKVIIIDHPLKWRPMMALMEWFEGSYYREFIKLDFRKLAREAGASNFSYKEIADCSVMVFEK
jgi:ubiquinone/menaquinone biosynthesis C-methylase UbiE